MKEVASAVYRPAMPHPLIAAASPPSPSTAPGVAAAVPSEVDVKSTVQANLKIKTVVGEVNPVYADALALRKQVFGTAKRETPERDGFDGLDAVSVHLVAYVNQTRRRYYLKQKVLQDHMKAVTHMPNLKLRTMTPEEAAAAVGERYRPPQMVPVAAARIRRANFTWDMGKLSVVIARLEWLCVQPDYRQSSSGVDASLIMAAEKVAREAFHVTYLMLLAPVQSKSAYTKLGYKVLSDGVVMQANTPHVTLVKGLNAEAKAASSNL